MCNFTKRKIIWITNSFDHDNYQFKEMVFNISQSYILFQIIINFLNNTWYLKISLGPMMCIVSTRLHRVHDNLRCESYDKGIRNILAPLSCSINFIPALFFFFVFSSFFPPCGRRVLFIYWFFHFTSCHQNLCEVLLFILLVVAFKMILLAVEITVSTICLE